MNEERTGLKPELGTRRAMNGNLELAIHYFLFAIEHKNGPMNKTQTIGKLFVYNYLQNRKITIK